MAQAEPLRELAGTGGGLEPAGTGGGLEPAGIGGRRLKGLQGLQGFRRTLQRAGAQAQETGPGLECPVGPGSLATKSQNSPPIG